MKIETPFKPAFHPSDFQEIPPLAMPRAELGRRHFPPGGRADTLRRSANGESRSLHASYEKSFEDHEIIAVEISPDDYVELVPNSLRLGFGRTQDGRTVLMQAGWRGCTAACAEMLKADRGLPISESNLERSNFGDANVYLEQAGLKVIVTDEETTDRTKLLSQRLSAYGSGVLGVGGHVVVLDKIDLQREQAVVRDPYHGWSVIVTLEGLLSRMSIQRKVSFVQVAREG